MRTILIADDSTTIRRVVEHAFSDGSVRVIGAADGPATLDLVRREQPDLVLCDVLMPGLTGYEVAETLSRDPQLKNIPVLLLTGAFEPFDEARAQRSGAVDHLSKPFESAELRRRVEDLLARLPLLRRIPVLSVPSAPETPPAEPSPTETLDAPRAPSAAALDDGPFADVSLPGGDWRAPGAPLPGDDDFDLSEPTVSSTAPTAFSPGASAVDASFTEAWRDECRRQVAALAPDIIREVAWEVIPDLLERLLREGVPPPPGPADRAAPEDEGDRRP